MNANRITTTQIKQTIKHAEIAAYALLALGLIGHLFFVDSQITAINIALLTSGIVFGMMVAVECTPVSKRIPVPDTLNLAEVFSFSQDAKEHTETSADGRRAA